MRYLIEKAEDPVFIEKFFKKNFKIYFPDVKKEKIKKIEIEKKSPIWAKDTSLLRYKIFFDSQLKIVRGSAKKTHSKKKIFFLMNYLYWHGFNKGSYRIPKPLDYFEKANLLLYEEVEGETFASMLAQNKLKKIEQNVKRIAQWLAKLHTTKIKGVLFEKALFLGKRKYQKMFSDIENLMPSLKKDLKFSIDLDLVQQAWRKKEYFALIHNDFYPGNIIIQDSKIFGIDFDRAGIGPFLMDLATFYGCFDFPKEIWQIGLTKSERKKIQNLFLKVYCKKRNMQLKKIKDLLKPFLLKIFLDQIHYHFYFAKRGWRYMDKTAKNTAQRKIQALIVEVAKLTEDL